MPNFQSGLQCRLCCQGHHSVIVVSPRIWTFVELILVSQCLEICCTESSFFQQHATYAKKRNYSHRSFHSVLHICTCINWLFFAAKSCLKWNLINWVCEGTVISIILTVSESPCFYTCASTEWVVLGSFQALLLTEREKIPVGDFEEKLWWRIHYIQMHFKADFLFFSLTAVSFLPKFVILYLHTYLELVVVYAIACKLIKLVQCLSKILCFCFQRDYEGVW